MFHGVVLLVWLHCLVDISFTFFSRISVSETLILLFSCLFPFLY